MKISRSTVPSYGCIYTCWTATVRTDPCYDESGHIAMYNFLMPKTGGTLVIFMYYWMNLENIHTLRVNSLLHKYSFLIGTLNTHKMYSTMSLKWEVVWGHDPATEVTHLRLNLVSPQTPASHEEKWSGDQVEFLWLAYKTIVTPMLNSNIPVKKVWILE